MCVTTLFAAIVLPLEAHVSFCDLGIDRHKIPPKRPQLVLDTRHGSLGLGCVGHLLAISAPDIVHNQQGWTQLPASTTCEMPFPHTAPPPPPYPPIVQPFDMIYIFQPYKILFYVNFV